MKQEMGKMDMLLLFVGLCTYLAHLACGHSQSQVVWAQRHFAIRCGISYSSLTKRRASIYQLELMELIHPKDCDFKQHLIPEDKHLGRGIAIVEWSSGRPLGDLGGLLRACHNERHLASARETELPRHSVSRALERTTVLLNDPWNLDGVLNTNDA